VIHSDDRLLPVTLAPLSILVIVSHELALLAEGANSQNGHVVKLLHVLADLRLGKEIVAAEVNNVIFVRLRRARQVELVRNEINLGCRLLKARSYRRLYALGVHILFKCKTILVVFVQSG
jgi:hypothetical protein